METGRVLIVDDNETNCKLIGIILRKQPFDILFAANGKEAILTCLTEPVNLILMDYNMPVMNGVEASKKIRLFKPLMPIILHTAFTYELSAIKELYTLFNAVITKPIIPKQLISMINKFLYNKNNIAC